MTMRNQRIILTGFMGSGKTAVARALGEKWQCEAIDLDEAIARAEGRTSSTIIEEDGEEAFRAIENQVLRAVLDVSATAQVIALGGGAWIQPENQEAIARDNCITIWLDAPFELCWGRISAGHIRPLAVDREQSKNLFEKRKPHYSTAQIRIEINGETTINEVAEMVERVVIDFSRRNESD